ncbi:MULTISPECIES: response regulator transcription factor [Paenibacillus]|uniref:response regulator transcription factor n=1 Tax=Paenibacillus TaxID=44249 RepID=UPI0022B93F14|nr:response regulator [Paenibacillus caseinilyticus]MCZ8523991.1 response regulator [Paenibacillus caseinilyticus]
MWKVLIVDDELSIRKGLRTLIDWQRYGFEVAGDAPNGREGLRLHGEVSPDLMVVDIKMPGMDGLQLLGEIRKTDPACRFLILSGYADFHYAKQAIGCGVDGYMLKPVDEEEVHLQLERIAAELERKAQTHLRSGSKFREELLRGVLTGGAAADEMDSAELLELTGGPGSTCGIVLLSLTPCDGGETPVEAHGAARRWLTERFDGAGFVFAAEPYLGLLLRENPGMPKVRQRLFEELGEGLAPLGLGFKAAAGPAAGHPAGLAASYAGAYRLLRHRFLLDGKEIHTRLEAELEALAAGEAKPAEKAAAAAAVEKCAEKLYFALDLGDKAAALAALEEAGRHMLRQDPAEQAVKTRFAQLVTVVLGKWSAGGTSAQPRVQDGMPVVAGLYGQPSYQAMLRYIGAAFEQLIDEAGSTSNEPVLKQMLHFIQRHYSENLKLETLAELFKYNSGYLGKLFKNYTGDSFHTYLDKVRIRRAIELLGEGLKVHQVAQLVGYANVDYFHSKFKKYVGMPPSAYKEKPQRTEVRAGGQV